MEFVRCVGHGVKLHVLLAQWGANTVVLKSPDPVNNHTLHLEWHEDRHRMVSKEEFVQKVRITVNKCFLLLSLTPIPTHPHSLSGAGQPNPVSEPSWRQACAQYSGSSREAVL